MAVPIISLEELKTQVARAKQALNSIPDTVHGLVDQSGTVHPDVQKLLDRVRQQSINHDNSMDQIGALVDVLFEQDIDKDTENQIKKEMDKQVAAIVKNKVAEELKYYTSEDRKKELDEIHAEIARLEIELYNSESRRENAFVKLDSSTRVLSDMKMKNGVVSEHFPKTTRQLQSLDGETIAKLMIDYEISSPRDRMPLRLNKFVHFCGLR